MRQVFTWAMRFSLMMVPPEIWQRAVLTTQMRDLCPPLLANYTAFLFTKAIWKILSRDLFIYLFIYLSIYLFVREYIFNFLSANVGELRHRFTSGLFSDVDDELKVCKFGLFFQFFFLKASKNAKYVKNVCFWWFLLSEKHKIQF